MTRLFDSNAREFGLVTRMGNIGIFLAAHRPEVLPRLERAGLRNTFSSAHAAREAAVHAMHP
jgi:hypothetical protein